MTPAAQGYRMPAEWTRHRRCWIGWPCREAAWPDAAAYEAARTTQAAVARAIAGFEPVVLVAPPALAATAARRCAPLTAGHGIVVVALPIDDSWLRDSAPSFVTGAGGRRAGVAWRFNAWGGKYHPFDQDARLGGLLLDRGGIPAFDAPCVMEGGAIHVDGDGTVLTTESVMLNPNRNGPVEKGEVERWYADYLGASTTIWLGGGLAGDDDTDGHVDMLACFVRPGVVLAQTCLDPADPDHPTLADNLARLRAATDARGRHLEVIEMPGPAPRFEGGRRLPLSYVNFYLAEGAVIAPVFDDPADGPALDTLARALPGRRIVPVPALALFRGGGGIHCITQQEPHPDGGWS